MEEGKRMGQRSANWARKYRDPSRAQQGVFANICKAETLFHPRRRTSPESQRSPMHDHRHVCTHLVGPTNSNILDSSPSSGCRGRPAKTSRISIPHVCHICRSQGYLIALEIKVRWQTREYLRGDIQSKAHE